MAVWHDIAARAIRRRPRKGAGPDGAVLIAETEAGPVQLHVWRGAGAGEGASVYIHFPDTGFLDASRQADYAFAASLADALGIVVLVVEIPSAPARRFPVQPTEAQALIWWAILAGRKQGWNGKRLALGGHGTGANLALGACLDLPARMGVRPAGVVALAPKLDLARATTLRERITLAAYLPDKAARLAPLASPALASPESLAHFAPSLIVVEEGGPRRDEGEAFAAMVQAAGREMRLVPVPHALAARDAVEGFLERVLEAAPVRS